MPNLKYKTQNGYVSLPTAMPGNIALLEEPSQGSAPFVPTFDPETEAVRVTPQTLTEAQKAQARQNIGAAQGAGQITDAASIGFGKGVCSTSSGTDLTATLTDYALVKNAMVTITFENDVPAEATLNINGQGAKAIYYKGAAIESGVIKADDTITFCYDGTNYEVISLGGGGSAAGLEIVVASGTTLNAEVGKYYRYDSDVSTLAVTLPTITGATEVQNFKLYFHTASSNVSVTFTGGTIKKFGDFSIIANNTYEVDCKWNGEKWILSSNASLPYDSKVTYLESTGTQYIDTGLKANGATTRVEMVIGTIINQRWAFGTRTAYRDKMFHFTNGGTGGNVYTECLWLYGSDYVYNNISNDNKVHNIIIASTSYFDGTKLEKAVETFTTDGTMVMFGFRDGSNINMTCYKVYSCKIYENSALLRDFIPVRIGQTGYMYDRITGQLFANLGTGNFTLGTDV